MAANKALERGTPLQFAMPAGVTILSGQPICVGQLAGVAIQQNIDPNFGNIDNLVAVDLDGAYNLTVSAVTVISPATGSTVNPGDKIYADGGTLDATSNVTYGFTLDKNASGILFGTALDKLTSGTTGTIRVRLKYGA